MPTITLSDDEAEKFASWLHDCFDEEFDTFAENAGNDYHEEAKRDLETLTAINTVYTQLGIAVFGQADLFEAYRVGELIEENDNADSKS